MKKILLLSLSIFYYAILHCQTVGIGTTTPNASAQLDVSSTSKGFLMPRMTTEQRNAIVSPAVGLQIFNVDDQCTDLYDGANWIKTCGLKKSGTAIMAGDNWIRKADFGGQTNQYAVGFSIGSKGYVGMGYYYAGFWEYVPSSNLWTQKADFGGGGRNGDATGFSIGTKGYLGTGAGYSDFWEYDPSNNLWTRKSDFGGGGRDGATGFSIGSKGYLGTGYVIGGQWVKDFWEYDPIFNVWARKADFGGTGRDGASGFSIENKGYIGTGGHYTSASVNDFWEYNPATDTWIQKANFGGSKRTNAAAFSIGSKGYLGTGSYQGYFLNDFWEYDPNVDTWSKKADFEGSARSFAAGFSIGTSGFIATGSGGNHDLWEYSTVPTNVPVYSSAILPIASSLSDGIWTRTGRDIVTNQNGIVGITGTIKITDGTQGANKVLTSDANGLASWKTISGASSNWNVSGSNIYNANTANVGIANADPVYPLDVNGRMRIRSTTASNTAGIWFNNLNNTASPAFWGMQSDNNLGLFGNGQFRFVINSQNGYVGIGHAFPGASLDIQGNIKILDGTQATNRVLTCIDASGIASWKDIPVQTSVWATTANDIYSNNTGNIGLGITNPSAKLQIEGALLITSSQSLHAQGAYLEWNKDGGSGKTYLLNQRGWGIGGIIIGEVDNTNNITEIIRLEQNGNTGIGSTAPLSKLEVNGPIATSMISPGSGTVTLDNTAGVWNFTANTQIVLPPANSCANRRYVLMNRYSSINFITSPGYVDLNTITQTTINPNSSIEIISNGTSWLQMK